MVSSDLIVTNIEKKGKIIKTVFSFGKEWGKYLKEDIFVCTFDKNIESVPDSLAVIPALCNLLPIAWVYDLKIVIPELDSVFYASIPNMLNGYKIMYPNFKFGGNVTALKQVKNEYKTSKVGVLFSGGVDATTTAFRHIDERPDIITVLGSDVRLDDLEGIKNINTFNSGFSRRYDLNYERVKSTFRTFLDEKKLQESEKLAVHNYGWWHEFQHGIGLIGLAAPLAFVNGYRVVYIASSYHPSQWGKYTCASDPVIDNQLKYGMTKTVHDGYKLTRQDKIKYICKFVSDRGEAPYLRVCWESSGGTNCCNCEKCRRTYLAILAEKNNPKDFGLDFSQRDYKKMVKWCLEHLPYNFSYTAQEYYPAIQEAFLKNYNEENMPKGLGWLRDVKIGQKTLPFSVAFKDRIREKLVKKIIA